MLRISAAILTLLAFSICCYADDAQFGKDSAAVIDFMLKQDYPELFGDNSYHVKVENILDADVLNDGSNDVVVLVTPNYRQSATILIYQISKDGTISRVTEGLAPGPVVPVSGKYLDSHVLAEAVDFSVPDKQHDPKTRQALIDAAIGKFGGFVAYADFFHGDNRHGPTWFVDMSDVQSPLEEDKCAKFEFSAVDGIAAGAVGETDKDNYLIAKVGNDFYAYLITGLRDKEFLNKKLFVFPVPKDFSGFVPGNPSPIQYQTSDGNRKELVMPIPSKE